MIHRGDKHFLCLDNVPDIAQREDSGGPAIDGSVLSLFLIRYWGRSFSTLLLYRSLVAESTACVCRFRRLSSMLAPSLGRTVGLCLEWRVSFMGLGLGSWVMMPWQTWSSSRQFTWYCAESISEWSLTFSVRDSWPSCGPRSLSSKPHAVLSVSS